LCPRKSRQQSHPFATLTFSRGIPPDLMKKKILAVIQIAVTLGILYWIFPNPKKIAEMWSDAHLSWIFIGVLAYGIVEILAAARWQILLRVQGVQIGSPRLFSLLMIGIFFNQFMPGGTGGDVVKIFYLLKETPGKKAQALLAVLIDRVIGLVGLMFVTGFIVWRRYDWLQQTEITKKLTWSLFAILGSSLAGIVFSFVLTGAGLVHKLPAKLPGRDKFIDLAVAYNAYAKAWKASFMAIVASLGVHIGSFYVFYAAAEALRAGVKVGDFFAVMPIINTISALPVSVGGTGVREGLFQKLLSALCGVDESKAVVISLTGFAIVLFWGLVGGVIYLFYRPSEHAKLADIRQEVHELEHQIAEEN
jgi:glycosyltransferase 2 family protein